MTAKHRATGPAHFRFARRDLHDSLGPVRWWQWFRLRRIDQVIARAQVHATLALVAATAVAFALDAEQLDDAQWREVLEVVRQAAPAEPPAELTERLAEPLVPCMLTPDCVLAPEHEGDCEPPVSVVRPYLPAHAETSPRTTAADMPVIA